ncbi:MAG TPA: hypothetical protein VKK06_00990 [Terriglobia bacterium]|nr:hypothetical protein [Terriglobia bacterium]
MKNLLTVVFAAFALLVVPAVTMGQHPTDGIDDAIVQQLNDPQEPGSVLVFPKFLRGTVQTESGVQPRTEIEISIRCPKGQICNDAGTNVNLRAHWVCPSYNYFAPCLETDFNLNRTIHGTLYFNPDNVASASNFTVPAPPCDAGYLIVWAVNANGLPIKFDGLVGDAVIREGPDSASAYNAIPIQAVSTVPTGGAISLGVGDSLAFDGRDGHYKALTGTVIGTVRYHRFPSANQGSVETSLTLLTLDVRSSAFNYPTFVNLRFWSPLENLLSTSTAFICWEDVKIVNINSNLTETFMGRKGLVESTGAFKIPIAGILDNPGPVTLLGLVGTIEFNIPHDNVVRGYMYSLYDDSTPVPTAFRPDVAFPLP